MKNNLKKARDLFTKGKYNSVLRLLEPLIFDYSESKTFFYYLGYSCLFSLDFHGAQSYLSKLIRIDPRNIDGLLGMAIIHVKREELKEAAALYLRVLEYNPRSKEAKAGLAYLRDNRDEDRVLKFFDNGKFIKLLPRHTRKRSVLVNIAYAVIILFVCGISAGTAAYFIVNQLEKTSRPGLNEIDVKNITTYATDDQSKILLSDDEVKQVLKQIFSYIDNYHDNLAQLDINKLLLSNASSEVKAKAKVLQKILKEPKFNSLKDNFSFEEVSGFPELYNDCYVIWSGRAANISITEEKISFSLLVGYEKGDVLEGVIPAYITFSTSIYQNMPVEILGRIESGNDGSKSLKVISVHRIINNDQLVK